MKLWWWRNKRKVKFPFDSRIHLTLEEARKIDPNIKLGDTIEHEVTPKDFEELQPQLNKLLFKRLENERNVLVEEFKIWRWNGCWFSS